MGNNIENCSQNGGVKFAKVDSFGNLTFQLMTFDSWNDFSEKKNIHWKKNLAGSKTEHLFHRVYLIDEEQAFIYIPKYVDGIDRKKAEALVCSYKFDGGNIIEKVVKEVQTEDGGIYIIYKVDADHGFNTNALFAKVPYSVDDHTIDGKNIAEVRITTLMLRRQRIDIKTYKGDVNAGIENKKKIIEKLNTEKKKRKGKKRSKKKNTDFLPWFDSWIPVPMTNPLHCYFYAPIFPTDQKKFVEIHREKSKFFERYCTEESFQNQTIFPIELCGSNTNTPKHQVVRGNVLNCHGATIVKYCDSSDDSPVGSYEYFQGMFAYLFEGVCCVDLEDGVIYKVRMDAFLSHQKQPVKLYVKEIQTIDLREKRGVVNISNVKNKNRKPKFCVITDDKGEKFQVPIRQKRFCIFDDDEEEQQQQQDEEVEGEKEEERRKRRKVVYVILEEKGRKRLYRKPKMSGKLQVTVGSGRKFLAHDFEKFKVIMEDGKSYLVEHQHIKRCIYVDDEQDGREYVYAKPYCDDGENVRALDWKKESDGIQVLLGEDQESVTQWADISEMF